MTPDLSFTTDYTGMTAAKKRQFGVLSVGTLQLLIILYFQNRRFSYVYGLFPTSSWAISHFYVDSGRQGIGYYLSGWSIFFLFFFKQEYLYCGGG